MKGSLSPKEDWPGGLLVACISINTSYFAQHAPYKPLPTVVASATPVMQPGLTMTHPSSPPAVIQNNIVVQSGMVHQPNTLTVIQPSAVPLVQQQNGVVMYSVAAPVQVQPVTYIQPQPVVVQPSSMTISQHGGKSILSAPQPQVICQVQRRYEPASRRSDTLTGPSPKPLYARQEKIWDDDGYVCDEDGNALMHTVYYDEDPSRDRGRPSRAARKDLDNASSSESAKAALREAFAQQSGKKPEKQGEVCFLQEGSRKACVTKERSTMRAPFTDEQRQNARRLLVGLCETIDDVTALTDAAINHFLAAGELPGHADFPNAEKRKAALMKVFDEIMNSVNTREPALRSEQQRA